MADERMDQAKTEAKSVADDARQSGQAVAQTAKQEVQNVAGEAKGQAQQLISQVRSEVSGQASSQQQKAAGALQSLAGELRGMADGTSSGSGPATGLARQAADQVDSVAGWLQQREPSDLLHELRRFARRKPGAFLAGAAAIGFLGGRMMKGLQADASEREQDEQWRQQYGSDWTDRPDRPSAPTAYGSASYGSATYGSAAYGGAAGESYDTPGYSESLAATPMPEAPGAYGAPAVAAPGEEFVDERLPGDPYSEGRPTAGGDTR